MISLNQIALQRVLRKKNAILAQLHHDVPRTTLLRHAKGKKPPSIEWIAFYEETLGWPWRDWFTPAQARAWAKKGRALRELVQEERMAAKV
jgi:hypothetical protein